MNLRTKKLINAIRSVFTPGKLKRKPKTRILERGYVRYRKLPTTTGKNLREQAGLLM